MVSKTDAKPTVFAETVRYQNLDFICCNWLF